MWLLTLSCSVEPAPVVVEAAPCTPTVSWQGWGEGFFTTWCGACHSATTPDRRGAPEGVDFDTPSEVEAANAAVIGAVLTDQRMPVGGGLSSADLATLEAYLACVDVTETSAAAVVITPVSLSLDDVATRIDAVLRPGLPRADTLWTAYIELLYTHGEVTCPEDWEDPLHEYHSSMPGCTTSEGWVFAGLTMREEEIDPDGVMEILVADGFVASPSGGWGVLAGENDWWHGAETSPRAWWQSVHGTWGWEWGDGWVSQVPSLSLDMVGEWRDSGFTATVEGGISTREGAVFLDGVVFDTEVCPGAPTSGTLSVRDDAGYWYPVVLRGDCSGCGTASDPTGAELGEECPDWGAVVASLGVSPS